MSNELEQKLNHETAQIPWQELQRYFASGNAIAIDPSLDLIQVAIQIADNNADQIKQWMDSALMDVVKDQQALEWVEQDAIVWAVVIKPWVLVQPISDKGNE